MEKKIQWGVLGCAKIARKVVLPALLQANNAELYAVASRSADRLDEFKPFNPEKYYDSYEALLDDPAVEAVYIPLPNGYHCEWAIKALNKKKYVLCEKPMGMNAEEVKKMQAAADENGVVIMEAFAYLHSPLIPRIKEVIQSGKLGKVNFVQSCFSFVLEDMKNVRMSHSIGGGAVYDLGCYTVSFAREIFGEEPATVEARATLGAVSGCDEDITIMMTFPSGLKVGNYVSFRSFDHTEHYIVGEKGFMNIGIGFNKEGALKFTVTTDGGTEEIAVDCPNNYMLEVEQMGRIIRNGEKPHVSYDFSVKNAEALDRILKECFDTTTMQKDR
jgi:predicted dehydrogenase